MDTVTLFSLLVENFKKLLILLLPWEGKEKLLFSVIKKNDRTTSHLAAGKQPIRTSVGDYGVCLALFLFITHSTSSQVNSGGQVWSVAKRNGLYDVNVSHPNSTGIKNCTSTTVLFILFYFIFSFPLSFSALNIALLNIYFSIPQTTQVTGGKKVNLFWFCLILLLLFDAYSSFLILRNCIFYGLLFCLFVFEGGGGGKENVAIFCFDFFWCFIQWTLEM